MNFRWPFSVTLLRLDCNCSTSQIRRGNCDIKRGSPLKELMSGITGLTVNPACPRGKKPGNKTVVCQEKSVVARFQTNVRRKLTFAHDKSLFGGSMTEEIRLFSRTLSRVLWCWLRDKLRQSDCSQKNFKLDQIKKKNRIQTLQIREKSFRQKSRHPFRRKSLATLSSVTMRGYGATVI